MLRVLFVLLIAGVLPGAALAETVVPLAIGGSQVRIAVDDDFVRLSEKLPTAFAMESAAAPKTNRLVEGFVSESDAKRIALGLPRQQALFEVHVIRDMEALDFTEADWRETRPMLAKAMGGVDLKSFVDGGQASANQRMTDTIGHPVAIRFGDVGKPVLYGDDPSSLRFVVLVSASVVANGKTVPFQLENAGAMVRLGNKLVMLYATRKHAEGDDTALVRAALDGFVSRAIALNPGAVAAAKPAVEVPASARLP